MKNKVNQDNSDKVRKHKREYMQKWREKNSEKNRETQKKYVKNNPEKYRKYQKEYRKEYRKKYPEKTKIEYIKLKEKKPWIGSFNNAKQRCTNSKDKNYHRYGGRGIKFMLSKNEIKELWTRDNANKMKAPSIDRINNNGNYEYSNCKFIEMIENVLKDTSKKSIIQYDSKDNFIRLYNSIKEAGDTTQLIPTNICACCNGRQKTAGGFIWKYAKENK